MAYIPDDPILAPDYNQGYPSPFLIHTESIVFAVDNPAFMFNWTPMINEGYPSKDDSVDKILVQAYPYPNILGEVDGIQNEGYPIIADTDAPSILVQSHPFPNILPALIPGINENYATLRDTDTPSVLVCKRPHPNVLFWLDYTDVLDGYPNHGQEYMGFGACSNIPTLEEVEIPESVKFIDDYAFYNSGIKKVKIASDCIYFRHSFPRGTRIAFYKDN